MLRGWDEAGRSSDSIAREAPAHALEAGRNALAEPCNSTMSANCRIQGTAGVTRRSSFALW